MITPNKTPSFSTGGLSPVELQDRLIKNPASLFAEEKTRYPGPYGEETLARFLPNPGLGECHCNPPMSRPPGDGRTIDLRWEGENVLFSAVENYFLRRDKLTVMSIGSGYCGQELVLHALISKINPIRKWILIDEQYPAGSSSITLPSEMNRIQNPPPHLRLSSPTYEFPLSRANSALEKEEVFHPITPPPFRSTLSPELSPSPIRKPSSLDPNLMNLSESEKPDIPETPPDLPEAPRIFQAYAKAISKSEVEVSTYAGIFSVLPITCQSPRPGSSNSDKSSEKSSQTPTTAGSPEKEPDIIIAFDDEGAFQDILIENCIKQGDNKKTRLFVIVPNQPPECAPAFSLWIKEKKKGPIPLIPFRTNDRIFDSERRKYTFTVHPDKERHFSPVSSKIKE